MIERRPIVKLDEVAVLQVQLRLLKLERVRVADLATNGYVYDSTFLDFGVIQEIHRVEPDLIVEEHNEFALEPLLYVFMTLTVRLTLAYFEPDCQLLAFRRGVIAVDDPVLRVHALEFLLVGLDFCN